MNEEANNPAPSTLDASTGGYADYTALRVAVSAGVAHVTIDHPPVNLLDLRLITELNRFAAAVRTDEHVRVIVFQSADPEFFLAHVDFSFSTKPELYEELLATNPGVPPLNSFQQLHYHFRTLPQVTIAKIAGLARGGGSEFALALDMRFAAIGRTGLGQPEARQGIVPGGGGTQYLSRLLGRARALEVMLGARLFDAELAERYGWINRALPPEVLDDFVDGLARSIAALDPTVVAVTKATVEAAALPLLEGLGEENAQLSKVFPSPLADALIRAALAAGGQTRDGERDLEGLLDRL